MKKNHIIYFAVLLYTVLQIFLIDIVSSNIFGILLMILPVVITMIAVKSLETESIEKKQKAFLLIYLFMLLPLFYFFSSIENNLSFTHNFDYFLKLVLIPSIIYIALSYLVYKMSFKVNFPRWSGVSTLIIGYSAIGFLMVFVSLMFGALLHHSV